MFGSGSTCPRAHASCQSSPVRGAVRLAPVINWNKVVSLRVLGSSLATKLRLPSHLPVHYGAIFYSPPPSAPTLQLCPCTPLQTKKVRDTRACSAPSLQTITPFCLARCVSGFGGGKVAEGKKVLLKDGTEVADTVEVDESLMNTGPDGLTDAGELQRHPAPHLRASPSPRRRFCVQRNCFPRRAPSPFLQFIIIPPTAQLYILRPLLWH